MSDVILEHRGRRIRPKTKNQKAYVDAIRSNTITFGIGPAGTGKTYLAMAMATAALLSGDVARIILTRPAVEAGEKLGFLPGGLMEKVDPYLRPLFDALYDMMDTDRLTEHLQRGTIEVAPLAYMRGRTLNDSLIILDEAQNTTPEQMKMFLTRLGLRGQDDRHRRHHPDRPAPGTALGSGERARRAVAASPTSPSCISTARTWCGTSSCRTSSRPTRCTARPLSPCGEARGGGRENAAAEAGERPRPPSDHCRTQPMNRFRFRLRERLADFREWIDERSPWRFELVLLACLVVGLTVIVWTAFLPALHGFSVGKPAPRYHRGPADGDRPRRRGDCSAQAAGGPARGAGLHAGSGQALPKATKDLEDFFKQVDSLRSTARRLERHRGGRRRTEAGSARHGVGPDA